MVDWALQFGLDQVLWHVVCIVLLLCHIFRLAWNLGWDFLELLLRCWLFVSIPTLALT